jgi:hypothetical protein
MLRPQNALLLMSGFPDAQQASRAATNFIVNIKGLRSGAVAVTGTSTSVGNQPAIVMTDINAAGGLEKHAPEALIASPKRIRKVRKKKK